MTKLLNENTTVFPIIVPVNFSLKTINFFLVQSNHFLTLIDAGMDTDDCWNELLHVLHAHDFQLQDIDQIILTHHHSDHCGLVNRILREHDVPVYAHSLAIPRLKRDDDFLMNRARFFKQLYAEMGCGEDGENHFQYLKQAIKRNKDKAIKADIHSIEHHPLDGFEAIHVPGHSPDQVVLFNKKENKLFAGDLLIEHISSNAIVEPDHECKRKLTLLEQSDSLKTCRDLAPDVVFPGHGTFIHNPEELIQQRLEGIERKADKIVNVIENGATTAADIAKAYYKDTYHYQFSLVLSEIIGQLDYLEYYNRVEKTKKSGVWHYEAI